jgi:hypothetical protein
MERIIAQRLTEVLISGAMIQESLEFVHLIFRESHKLVRSYSDRRTTNHPGIRIDHDVLSIATAGSTYFDHASDSLGQ